MTYNAAVLETRVGTLEAKLEVQLDQNKGQGIIFGGLAFTSQAQYNQWHMAQNSLGRTFAAFVDFTTIWSYTSLDQVTTAN